MPETYPISFGRYKLVERLAVGGMAELFLAEVTGAHGFQKTVVIKRILPRLVADPHFTSMFIDEAKITARLAHPKIAQTYELGRHGDQLFISMEFVDGLDTLAMLKECAARRVRLPPEVVVYICHEVLDALDFAHNVRDEHGTPLGIVHRDISPSNVLVSRRGDVKLVDFGIAQALHNENRTEAGTLKGKYGYMSPEQILGEALDARSDIFSVGIILAEMLMGRRLFAAANDLDVLLMVRDVNLERLGRFGAELQPELLAIVRRALQKQPGERFGSAAEFRDALGDWLFENRYRITPRALGALVVELYEDAWRRRRAAMLRADASAVPEAVPPQPSAPALAIGSDRSPADGGLIAGIPAGEVEPGADMQPEIEIEAPAEADIGGAAAVAPELEVVEQPAPRASVRLTDDSDLVLDLDFDLELPALELGAAGPGAVPGGDYGDDDIPIIIEDPVSGPVTLAAEERGAPVSPIADRAERSMRFSSIEAAVTSLSTPEESAGAAGAAAESGAAYDDGDIAGDEPELRARPRRPRAPTQEEIAAAASAGPPPLDEITGDPDERGSFSSVPPIRTLYRLAVAEATGLLVVQVGAIRKEIYFKSGKPEFVSSNVASELFGAYLVKHKTLSPGELDMALAMMPHYGGKLGDTLVGLGLMKPLDVFRHLGRQVTSRLIDVCTWQLGTYAWYDGRENPREAFPLDLDPFAVVGAGAMALGESQVLKWAEGVAHLKVKSIQNQSLGPDDLQLGAWVRDVFDGLDGMMTVWELAGRYTDDAQRVDFLRLLFLLTHTDLAVLDD